MSDNSNILELSTDTNLKPAPKVISSDPENTPDGESHIPFTNPVNAVPSVVVQPLGTKTYDYKDIDFENNEITFLVIVRWMIWKNFLQQWKRRKCSLACKLMCPAVCVLLLGLIRSIFPSTQNTINYNGAYINDLEFVTASTLESNYWIIDTLCILDTHWSSFKEAGYIAISPRPSSSTHLQQLMDIMNDSWAVSTDYSSPEEAFSSSSTCSEYAAYLPFDTNWLLRFFDSDDEIDEYVSSSSYSTKSWDMPSNGADDNRPISFAISFTDISDDGLVWQYNIRQNTSVAVDTSGDNINKFERDVSELYTKYAYNGFIRVQTFVDNAIMQYIAELELGYSRNESAEFIQLENEAITKGVFQFPLAAYETDDFWPSLSFMFWMFVLIQYLYPFCQVTSQLIQEKADRIKEGMKMMGATVGAFWFSWYLWLTIEFTIITLLVTVLEAVLGIFKYSDFGIIFLWTWLFLLMLMSYGTLISTFFDNPKVAILVAILVYIVSLISFLFGDTMTSESQKNALCLVGPACYALSLGNIIQYESSLLGIQWDNIDDVYENFRFSSSLWFMTLDIFIYILLTLYFDRVWPSRYGQRLHPLFFVLPSFWFPNREHETRVSVGDNELPSNYETVQEFDANGNRRKVAIAIRGLKKFFGNTFSSNLVLAVNGIDLDVYEGEIFCLLGHNGAGKTTTIGMLTGLLTVTEGRAFIDGHDVKTDMVAIRKSLGVCPQHDVLWPRLTAFEHLQMFARLKGVPESNVQNEVHKAIHMCGIADKASSFPTQMSGGQKRKLSLAIALIGGSKIVFLDEPTSGMDPQSRRVTWDLIQKEKKNRCIILTTHFMDEADILGDRIAIMSDGQIRCCGTSLFLKRLYGVGYTFVISLKIGVNPQSVKRDIDDIVLGSIQGATVISVAGGELAFRLPFSESGSFPGVFNAIEESKERLFINAYGISVTTLEEVFLTIGEKHGHAVEGADHKPSNVDDDEKTVPLLEDNTNDGRTDERNALTGKEQTEAKYEEVEVDANSENPFEQPTFQLEERNECFIILIHIWAIIYRRFFLSIRDFRPLCCQILLPSFFSFFGLLILSLTTQSTPSPSLLMTSDQWYSPSEYNIPINEPESSATVKNAFLLSKQTYFDEYMADYAGKLTSLDVSPTGIDSTYSSTYETNITYFQNSLLDAYSPSDGILHYNAFYAPVADDSNSILLGINLSATHSIPISFAMIDNWILSNMTGNGDAQIYVSSYPFPQTTTESAFNEQIGGMFAAIFLMIAFAFIPVGAVYNIVNDRMLHTKHQQMVSGLSFISYWIGNIIADFIACIPATIIVIIMIHAFDATSFLNDAEGPFIIILYMFVLSILPFTYLLSYLFHSGDKAQMWVAVLYLVLGMILLMVSFIVGNLPDSSIDQKGKDSLDDLYRIFPSFLMAHALFQLALQPLLYSDLDVWDESIVGKDLRYMCYEFFGYFALLLLIEYLSSFPAVLKKLGFIVDLPMENETLDEDVEQEQRRIKAMVNDEGLVDKENAPTVLLAGVRKVYGSIFQCFSGPPLIAVRNIWLGIPQGEVFGYLGVNGAGKTTTLACLTGERILSSGSAYIYGNSIVNQNRCRRYVGYCPQFDALFDLLTAREHLRFYALIKGLSGDELKRQVNMLLKVLSLEEYQNRRAGTYSGGNKRKLSVAIAMIGNPPVVFLDEPSTGMDPMARRHMWEFIRSTMKGRCVVLTTHSMEECEALCHRLGIMVDGQLQCIGTPQHLKSRFGHGYQLDITMVEDTVQCQNAIVERLRAVLGMDALTMVEHSQTKLVFEIGDENISLGMIFGNLEQLKDENIGIESYAVNQTSLEQIFIKMAKHSGAISEF